jgi:hypothetical protein
VVKLHSSEAGGELENSGYPEHAAGRDELADVGAFVGNKLTVFLKMRFCKLK